MKNVVKILSLCLISSSLALAAAPKANKQDTLIKESIRTIPDFPKAGIQFRDVTTLLSNPKAFKATLSKLENHYKNQKIDAIIGLESRGFIFGAALADRLGIAFIPVRKPGKLPADTHKVSFEKEYGKDTFEMHKDSLKPGQRVVITDDLLATGGSANAAIELAKMAQAEVVEVAVVVELPELKGREKVKAPVYSVVSFEGE